MYPAPRTCQPEAIAPSLSELTHPSRDPWPETSPVEEHCIYMAFELLINSLRFADTYTYAIILCDSSPQPCLDGSFVA